MRKFNITLLVLALLFSFKLMAIDEWQQTSGPKLDENTFESVYSVVVDGDGNIYAGTSSNGVYKSTDSGQSWEHIFQGDFVIWKLAIDNNGYLFLATEFNGIYRSIDHGANWTHSFDTDSWVTSITCSPTNILYCATEMYGVYYSVDNGDSWDFLWAPDLPVISLTTDENETIYAGTIGDGIYKSTDLGATWNYDALSGYFIWDLDANTDYTKLFAATEEDGLWKLNLTTNQWEQIGFPNQSINSIAMNSEGIIAVSSYGTDVYISDANYLWYPFTNGLGASTINSLAFNSEGYLFAGLYDFGVYETVKSTFAPTLSTNDLLSFSCAGTNNSFHINATGGYYPDNEFKIEMSDATGDFNNSIILGSQTSQVSTDIGFLLPVDLPFGDGYRTRIVSTNPVLMTEVSNPFTVGTLKPQMYLPENLVTDVALKPVFTWENMSNCVIKYKLMVDNNIDFSSPEIDEFDIAGATFEPTVDLLPNTTYYWKVAGVNNDDLFSFNEPFSFTTISTSLTAGPYPTVICAGTFETISYTIQGNFENNNEFKVELSDENGNFDNQTLVGSVLSQTSGQIMINIPATSIHSTNYKLRVLSTNPTLVTEASANVEIKSIKPELLIPSDNSTEVSINPILEWGQPSDCVSTYRLLLDDNSDFSSPVIEELSLIDNNFEVLNDLDFSTTYYWKVAGINSENVYVYSDVFMFTTGEPVEITQNVELEKGWNLISLYVTPTDPNMIDIFVNIKNKITIAKTIDGKIYLTSNDFNQIGDWDVKQGYMVYASEACTLSVIGLPVVPEETPISFSKNGWYYVSYLRNSEQSIVTSLETLTTPNKMIIAKTVKGAIYFPPTNNIGNMKPGLGYQIYISGAATLTYPAN